MDMHTLHIEHAVLLGLYTLLTVINSLLHRGTRGVGWFPIYNLCAFIGAVLIASRGHIPDFISIVVGALFFPIAYIFLHRCVTEFLGYRSYQWQLQTALTLLSLAVLVRYEWVHPDTQKRLVAYSFILAVQLGLSAIFVFRHLTGFMRVSGGLLGAVLALLCLNNLVRGIGILFAGAPVNYLSGGPFLSWSLLVTSVMQGGITVAVVWMTAAVLRQDLQIIASTDSLTGLLNRRAIEVAAEREIALSQQTHQPLSAILLDLDGFKQINDSLGHRYGDDALIAVAFSLQKSMRQQDLLARLGGDEFIVLLLNTHRDVAVEIAERLRASLEDLHIVGGPHQTHIRASFGISELQHAQDWDHLVMNCDNALYEVKAMGGNLIATR